MLFRSRIVVSGRLLQALDEPGRAALVAHERAHLAGRHHLFTTVAHLAAAANPVLVPLARTVDYTVERWADEQAAVQAGNRALAARAIARAALATSAAPPDRGAAMSALGLVTQEDKGQEPQENQACAGVSRASLPRAVLPGTGLSGASLPGAGLSRAALSRAGLPRSGLSRLGLPRSGLSRLGLSRGSLPRVNLRGAGPVPRRVAALLAPPPRLRLLLLVAAVVLVAVAGASALEAVRNFHQLIELAQGQSA